MSGLFEAKQLVCCMLIDPVAFPLVTQSASMQKHAQTLYSSSFNSSELSQVLKASLVLPQTGVVMSIPTSEGQVKKEVRQVNNLGFSEIINLNLRCVNFSMKTSDLLLTSFTLKDTWYKEQTYFQLSNFCNILQEPKCRLDSDECVYHPDLPENKKSFGEENLEVYFSYTF